ncbi:MAG: hypothetical protein KKH94_02240 [Candidatus Omnitrophica bacterium]|nr:hypothetical protein [Candidatus Omnitrophota bacterium]
MKKKLRSQYIVQPKLQYKLMFLVLLSIMIPALLTFICLFALIRSIILDAQINNEMVYTTLFFLSRKIYIILTAGFFFIAALLLFWTSLFFHRIVGPLYRLENEIDKCLKGTRIRKITFRKHDKYKSLAHKINALVEKVQKSD